MSFAVIAIMQAADGGMGYNNNLPWHVKEDLLFFKDLTTTTKRPDAQNVVIMGHNTFVSLPKRPLPQRYNIVLSRHVKKVIGADATAASLDEALKACPPNTESVFVIGGVQVFIEALQHSACQRVYLNTVNLTAACDVFFPRYLLADQFAQIEQRFGAQVTFQTYERILAQPASANSKLAVGH
jgi:dihydrofolate reductase